MRNTAAPVLSIIVLFCLTILGLEGCASNRSVSLATPSEKRVAELLDSTRLAEVTIKQDSVRKLALQEEIDSLKEIELRNELAKAPKSKKGKAKEIAELYVQAKDELKSSPNEAKATISEAILQIAEVLETNELDNDSAFCSATWLTLQLYDKHVQSLKTLDSDNPALSIYERLFGDTDNIKLDENLFLGIFIPRTEIPLELNSEVKKYIGHYSKGSHEIFQRYLERAQTYFPMMRPIIAEEKAPPEIIYLSLIESGVNPHAKSRTNAVGVWQFMKPTGKLYGLEGNKWFDERRNIEKATRSSMKHLNDLHTIFGDWYLALAAYNAGPGKVRKAMRLSKSKDFWTMRKYFRRETREYVPRFIAAAIIALYPEKFGFKPLIDRPTIPTEEIPVPQAIPLATISSKTGIDFDTLKFLNPELVKEITPPAYENYKLKVRVGEKDKVKAVIDSLPNAEKHYFIVHKAKSDMSLKEIAKKHRVPAEDLKVFNEFENWNVLKGAVVMIPATADDFQKVGYSISDLSDDSRRVRIRRRRTKKKASAAISKANQKSVAPKADKLAEAKR